MPRGKVSFLKNNLKITDSSLIIVLHCTDISIRITKVIVRIQIE
nr:MAG TPA: hypothetical protein [Caudoviricetes sp.]DAQ45810.1 MAG TPA: hypothetical protein [Caudoviricetes sp.]